MPRAIVFDSDGTLINSFEMIVAAYHHVAKQFGYTPPTADQVRPQLGKALPDIYSDLFPGCDVSAMLAANDAFIAANASQSSAFQGLHEMLESLKSAGIPMAIVTGGNHKIYDVLAHHDIVGYFASVVHCEHVHAPKPDPEGFLKALAELHITPDQAIMVGDTPNDIFAGKNGGAWNTVAITHGYGNRADLVAADADYIVDSLDELEILLTRLCRY